MDLKTRARKTLKRRAPSLSVALIGALATLGAWFGAMQFENGLARGAFAVMAERTVGELERQLGHTADIARSLRGLVLASRGVTVEEWVRHLDSMEVGSLHPAVLAAAFADANESGRSVGDRSLLEEVSAGTPEWARAMEQAREDGAPSVGVNERGIALVALWVEDKRGVEGWALVTFDVQRTLTLAAAVAETDVRMTLDAGASADSDFGVTQSAVALDQLWRVRVEPSDSLRATRSLSWATALLGGFATLSVAMVVCSLNGGRDRARMIAEQMTAASRAREAEVRKLALVASTTDTAVALTDPRGVVEWVNDAFERLTERVAGDAIGRSWDELLICADGGERCVTAMRERFERGEGFRTQMEATSRTGRRLWLSIDGQPISDGDRGPTQYALVISDVTELQSAQKEQQKFVSLVENSSDFIAMASLDGHVFYLNEAGRRYAGVTSEKLVSGETLSSYFGEGCARMLRDEAIPEAMELGIWEGEAQVRSLTGGGIVDLAMTVFVIRDGATGDPICLACAGRDITSLKEAQEELQLHAGQILRAKQKLEAQAQDLSASNRELSAARVEAEAASRAKSEFLANMSHEIRTPMTAILGCGDLLLEESLSEQDRREYVSTIHRNGEHLLTVINDILDLSKIEAGKMDIHTAPCSPATIVADVATTMRVRAEERGLALRVEATTPFPRRVVTDETRLRQILINLLSNAIKFTERGEVCVRVGMEHESGEPRLRVSVSDTGVGMNARQMDRLFRPFTQADSSMTRRYGGTGLGLTISRRLARLLGGDIAVVSEEGRGSTFTVRVRAGVVAGAQLTERIVADDARDQVRGEADARLSGRVLLAEDGRDNQRLISHLLRVAGAEVVVARNGLEAVDAWSRAEDEGSPFGLILMDMQMPELDGYGATARLRSRGCRAPIIALTAHAMAGDRERCLAAGCDDYATKPVHRPSLLRMCAEHMRDDGRGRRGAA